ncbi:hypothetical protein Ga0123462_1431 [Mariprofundus ferrinatatus]|uniref:Uncharacterized protein n=1 Tax=Mariprofundus ferrinatatus TaxID=1921087 RepID=A0A2K8LBJ1_9PROT|nr:hypothetical protein [Mariprofundus ferrinatatus]ATX82294.1 hypothetical protein Ga0123462_1431 [Mariprofundus ferrinatatus]
MHIFSTEARLAEHYSREDGRYLIEVHLREAKRLFNSLDPAPFIEKDLDADAENYILDTAKDFPLATPLKLVIYLPEDEYAGQDAASIPEAIENYFGYRAHQADMNLRFIFLQGRTSLMIGLLFLFGCLFLRELLSTALDAGLLHDIVEEGLMICGWVAMWRPIQIYLYDWWPIRRLHNIYEKIRAMPIEIRKQPNNLVLPIISSPRESR